MLSNVFEAVRSEIVKTKDVFCRNGKCVLCFNMYGHGEGILHPDFKSIVKSLRDLGDNQLEIHIAISSDIHTVKLKKLRQRFLSLDTLLVSYKYGGVPTKMNDLDWLSEIGYVRHHFITGIVDDLAISDLTRIANSVPECQSGNIFISPDHGLSFEFRDESLKATRKMNFSKSAISKLSISQENLDNILEGNWMRIFSKRAYFDVDGGLRNCLLLNSCYQNLRDHLNGPSRCLTCRSREVNMVVRFKSMKGVV